MASWNAVSHSAIGTRHVAKNMPCQDYGGYQVHDDIIYGAVADGAGSAKHSDVGAKLAVNTWIESAINKFKAQISSDPDISEINFQSLFLEITESVLTRLETEASQEDFPLKELGCTLICFIASPDWIAAMQIGDGFIVFRSEEDDQFQLLFQPDKGEYINETLFVTSKGALQEIQHTFQNSPPKFICAATDGLEKVAIKFQDWTPHTPFFKPFQDCLHLIPEQSQRQAYIETFLESDRLNAKTDDDKTMLLCLAVDKGED